MAEIILASKSGIRRKMMDGTGLKYEVIVSDADETPDLSKSFGEQLEEIALRKAQKVFEETKDRGERIIVAADQNIVFKDVMYGKPKTIDEARELLHQMKGSKIYAYVGNAIIYADHDKMIKIINNFDIATMYMENVSDEVLEDYLKNNVPLTKCGGISISDASFLHLKYGRMSTAMGMTIEFFENMLSQIS